MEKSDFRPGYARHHRSHWSFSVPRVTWLAASLCPRCSIYTRQVSSGSTLRCSGFSRSALSEEDFGESWREGVQQFARHKAVDEPAWQEFSSALHYQRGQFDDPSSYRELADRLAKIDGEHGTAGNRLFYLATPPEVFPVILQQLGAAGLNRPRGDGFVRIVVEKPFGTDLESARQLNHQIQQVFTESQVYRIDHYLG